MRMCPMRRCRLALLDLDPERPRLPCRIRVSVQEILGDRSRGEYFEFATDDVKEKAGS